MFHESVVFCVDFFHPIPPTSTTEQTLLNSEGRNHPRETRRFRGHLVRDYISYIVSFIPGDWLPPFDGIISYKIISYEYPGLIFICWWWWDPPNPGISFSYFEAFGGNFPQFFFETHRSTVPSNPVFLSIPRGEVLSLTMKCRGSMKLTNRRSFPFGIPYFQGQAVSFRECRFHETILRRWARIPRIVEALQTSSQSS